jgi:nicotinate phosphoribosyltransferase
MNTAERRMAEGILFTDMYQLTMAHLYYRMGLHERPAYFEHFFRNYPNYGTHQAGYCISAGLAWLLDWMGEAAFGEAEVEYLRGQTGPGGARLFEDDFLGWLQQHGHFQAITLRAIPEGRVVHPNVPLTAVQGPLAMAQILETALLNRINFQTLIATKAARVLQAGRGRLVLEFGLRRAQDRGAIAATRAALIGGADFSSNVGASKVLGFPPKGTHAHAMVQVFMALGGSELDAFRAYADLYPDNCLFLVDTINTLESGVPNAIKVFEEVQRKGHKPVGIRLDSGDLAYLSIQAAKLLNQAGFPEASIVLSNNLDEITIWQILTQIEEEAPRYGVEPSQLIGRLVYGVGTKLITSEGDSALGGVYKLVAMQEHGNWVPAIKISETPEKTPTPGRKDAWRLYDQRGKATADLLSLDDEHPSEATRLVLQHPIRRTLQRTLNRADISQIEPLLVEVLHEGKLVYELPTIEQMRAQRNTDLEALDPGVRRLVNPHIYHVSVTEKLWQLKQELIESARVVPSQPAAER